MTVQQLRSNNQDLPHSLLPFIPCLSVPCLFFVSSLSRLSLIFSSLSVLSRRCSCCPSLPSSQVLAFSFFSILAFHFISCPAFVLCLPDLLFPRSLLCSLLSALSLPCHTFSHFPRASQSKCAHCCPLIGWQTYRRPTSHDPVHVTRFCDASSSCTRAAWSGPAKNMNF